MRQASTTDADYLKEGFVAKSRADEIAGPDYEVWITRSCVDVSEQLSESRKETDPLKRANLVRDRKEFFVLDLLNKRKGDSTIAQ